MNLYTYTLQSMLLECLTYWWCTEYIHYPRWFKSRLGVLAEFLFLMVYSSLYIVTFFLTANPNTYSYKEYEVCIGFSCIIASCYFVLTAIIHFQEPNSAVYAFSMCYPTVTYIITTIYLTTLHDIKHVYIVIWWMCIFIFLPFVIAIVYLVAKDEYIRVMGIAQTKGT